MKIKKAFIIVLTLTLIFCNACEGKAAKNNAQSIQCGEVITEVISKDKNELTFLFHVTKTGYYDFEFLNPIFKEKAYINGLDSYYYENVDSDVDEHPDFGEWNEERQDCILTTYLKKGQKYYITVQIDAKAIKKDTTISLQLRSHVHKYEILGCSNKTIDYYCEGCTKAKHGYVSIKLSKTVFVYNGKKQQPKVTVKNTQNPQLTKKDYKVSMPNSKTVGTYTVTVTYKNQYKDLKKQKKTYKIVPKGTDIKSLQAKKKGLTVKWKKQTTQTSGYQIQYATNAKMKKAKTINVASNKMTKKTVSRLSKKKTYYVRIRTYKKIKSKKYVSSWSSIQSVRTE